jgi:hypothetical protein
MRAGDVVRTTIGLLLALVSAGSASPPGSDKTPVTPALRWEEGQPGCTFSRDDDGKYRYGFWTADFGIVLAVDSQELEKARRRGQAMFAVLLTMHYRGKDSVDVAPGKITLEFVKHYDVHPALHPDSLATKQQSDADALAQETEREIRKHPEKKEEKETLLAAGQKDAAEMIEFLRTRSLRAINNTGHRTPRNQRLGVIQQQEQMDRRLAEAGGIRATGALRKPDRRVPVLAAAERGRFNSAAPTGELIKKLRLHSAATLER